MQLFKLAATLGALTLSTLGVAQTTFECGSVACSAFGNQPITGIDDLVVGGDHFDVTFSTTQDSTFLFSSHAAAAGQPLTGVDAANALDAFYATQMGPNPQDDGPGIFARIGGVDVDVLNIVTASQTTGTRGVVNIDITEPFLGISVPGDVAAIPVGAGFLCSSGATCTVWTPVAAPEISPASSTAALTLLLGSALVLRGGRPGRRRL
jgi:hypothetical protein